MEHTERLKNALLENSKRENKVCNLKLDFSSYASINTSEVVNNDVNTVDVGNDTQGDNFSSDKFDDESYMTSSIGISCFCIFDFLVSSYESIFFITL